MKNIHLLPTDKGQRITKTNKGTFLFCSVVAKDFIETRKDYSGFHLYITSDEEIKDGDWFLFPLFKKGCKIKQYDSEKHFAQEPCISLANLKAKKIILTTDQSLEGIQVIDDKFLEWFVKNPSCESVEVKDWYKEYLSCCRSKEECYCNKKRIIIPSDEAKQRAKNYMSLKGALEPNQIKCYCGHTSYCDCSPLDEPQQETTLEEVAINRWAEGAWDNRDGFTDGFVEGAKWQKNDCVKFINKLEDESFDGWSEEVISGYLTACMTIKQKYIDTLNGN
jgi:hypothetical protein